ncbi:hypothetical protein COCC4DRAFT_32560 [Bipolaris maydis ATCC 48331]|uniref:Uncharacterized protein n=2 Tax=Cochliobolus heterostrophus TaxID=5016 RepID=M2UFD3_COCH5|nr:uncharacterized protein COCC4DRAFT_32560 [Bipolaris maydis ATCC 48331]EMD97199.1 hypothetical protein COCHEDRAFT_1018807 [Bipolaris maydis C5]KAH7551432.1 hypothetical protein BM1_09748 [Bipolaris maydis]ENI04339.1 hypothetical protein COCC4DRAFT_32560 [Bipolaris maydis ATCC 48331]KAJ5029640.1 hypothetical protein J3E73DRAFT_287359 [Bipolaris maydis]KAJ5040669.1 hypothetical protein J3E74DRAFT_396290 [Bipolaris maydis]
MKLILSTLLLATLATATPSSPFTGASIEQCNEALIARAAHAYTDAHSHLAARSNNNDNKKNDKRATKPKKPKGGHSNSENDTETESAAMARFVPSMGALQVGVVGFGVLEVVRLWG